MLLQNHAVQISRPLPPSLLCLPPLATAANTALVYHGGSLLALQEADMPYAVRVLEDGELETVGRINYGGALDHVITAHPKVDTLTGNHQTLLCIGCQMSSCAHTHEPSLVPLC